MPMGLNYVMSYEKLPCLRGIILSVGGDICQISVLSLSATAFTRKHNTYIKFLFGLGHIKLIGLIEFTDSDSDD